MILLTFFPAKKRLAVKVSEGPTLRRAGKRRKENEHNSDHIEGIRNEAYAIIDIAERRAPASNGNAQDVLDSLLAVIKLGPCLFVGHTSHVGVRPGVLRRILS